MSVLMLVVFEWNVSRACQGQTTTFIQSFCVVTLFDFGAMLILRDHMSARKNLRSPRNDSFDHLNQDETDSLSGCLNA